MKRVSISGLVPGMITAEEIYDLNHHMILPKGLVLTDHTITKLELYSILSIKVEDPKIENEEAPQKAAVDNSYAYRLKKTPEFQRFEENFLNLTNAFKNIMDQATKNVDTLDTDQMLSHVDTLLHDKDKRINVFDMLHNMREFSDATYIHCINVGLICNILAHWLHMSPEDIKTATLCGLLHDVGKLMIPDNILAKPGKLTDWEYRIMQTHPKEGYDLLKSANISEHIKNAALMHHERCDGSGYPKRLRTESIDPYAKMVAIADVYDAMTSARLYRGPQCPFKVISAFENEGLQKYDPHYILTFLKNIVDTYLGQSVRLSNGEVGEIVFINQTKLSRPTVKVGEKYIDLAAYPSLYIDAVV